jgi:hypothetical protein
MFMIILRCYIPSIISEMMFQFCRGLQFEPQF